MSTATERTADPAHPQYIAGRAAANRSLDRGSLNLQDLLGAWEQVARDSHQREDVGRFHYAQGQVDALRDFRADRRSRR